MKTRHLILALTLFMLVLGACREITVTTKVNNDGSFIRIIKVKGDSSEVFTGDLPFRVDSTWTREVSKDTAKGSDYTVTYSKYYRQSDILNSEIRSDTSWMKGLDRKVTVTKRFAFFYSHLEFREVYGAANPFRALDYRKFLTREDLQWLARSKPVSTPADSIRAKDAEDKAMKFMVESATAEIMDLLKEAVTRLDDPRLDPKEVSKYHDSISETLTSWKFASAENFAAYYRLWTGNPAADRLMEVARPVFTEMDTKTRFIDSLFRMQEFREEAEMPGLITATNSYMLKGNQAAWDVHPMAFFFEDYVMTAESRVLNTWAFILLGAVVLLLLILLGVRLFRRQA